MTTWQVSSPGLAHKLDAFPFLASTGPSPWLSRLQPCTQPPVDEAVVHGTVHQATNPYAVDGAQHGALSWLVRQLPTLYRRFYSAPTLYY